MQTQYKIISAEKIIIEGKTFIDVLAEFFQEGKETAISRRFNYSVTTTADEINADLAQQCVVIDTEVASALRSKKSEEEENAADETIGSLIAKEEEK